ncbi:MAG: hypothetical protein AWU59_2534 [Methanolobus sp. T82-4]|jgi:hypothetical protein|nr:MAG: hypothetical protein AWU59_2534 [Methanolobus sp. T82-4]
MDQRKNIYVSAFVGASLAYIFTVIAFTGKFSVLEWAVFAVFFLLVMYGFEKFIKWTQRFEN